MLVLEDAIQGVEVHPGDCQRAIEELNAAGARFVSSSQLSTGNGTMSEMRP